MQSTKILVFILLLFFLVIPKTVFAAATIAIDNTKTQLQSVDEEYPVDVTLSINASDETTYYLRGVFYKQDTTNYCGYTWNGSTWFKGPYSSSEGWKNFLPISITNDTWIGTLKAKIDIDDSGCSTSGTYNFKIQRFTANSGSGTFDTQNEQTVTIVIPTPTASPTSSPTPSPTSKPSPTSTLTPTVKPTSTPKPPTPTPTKAPTSTPAPTKTATPTAAKVLASTATSIKSTSTIKPTAAVFPTAVLGESTESADSSLSKDDKLPAKNSTSSNKSFPVIFIVLGIIFISACGIVGFWKFRKKTSPTDNE